MKALDITGQRFGRLTAIKRDGSSPTGQAMWICVCDCGNSHRVAAQVLSMGRSSSCGCLATETRTKHGGAKRKVKLREYKAWSEMKKRCNGKGGVRNARFYLTKGITVCARWSDSFQNFLADMGPCPDEMTLDRVDPTKGYFPENCRWANWETQHNNTRRNKFLSFGGETLTYAQWERKLGMSQNSIRKRVRRGWPTERILTEPVRVTKATR